MKAQFKYAFRTSLSPRLIVFAIILVMNLAFIIPAMIGILPIAAMITGVSLSGSAIAVMFTFNLVGDIQIIRRMFSPSGAVLYAITPTPRRNTLIASIVSMTIMDFVTMAISIVCVVILSLNLAGHYMDDNLWVMLNSYYINGVQNILIPFANILAAYLFVMMLVIFCCTIRKSVFFSKPAGGFLTFLVAVGILFIANISTLLLAPFGYVSRLFIFFTVTVGFLGFGMYALLQLIFAAVLFVLTTRLLERRINI